MIFNKWEMDINFTKYTVQFILFSYQIQNNKKHQ